MQINASVCQQPCCVTFPNRMSQNSKSLSFVFQLITIIYWDTKRFTVSYELHTKYYTEVFTNGFSLASCFLLPPPSLLSTTTTLTIIHSKDESVWLASLLLPCLYYCDWKVSKKRLNWRILKRANLLMHKYIVVPAVVSWLITDWTRHKEAIGSERVDVDWEDMSSKRV